MSLKNILFGHPGHLSGAMHPSPNGPSDENPPALLGEPHPGQEEAFCLGPPVPLSNKCRSGRVSSEDPMQCAHMKGGLLRGHQPAYKKEGRGRGENPQAPLGLMYDLETKSSLTLNDLRGLCTPKT